MIKARTRKRVSFINHIRFGPNNPPEDASFITNFSDRGAHIKTNRVYEPGTKLYLNIDTPDKKCVAEGIVVWAKKTRPMLAMFVRHGMGIKFTHVNQDLVDLYDEKLNPFLSKRRAKRVSFRDVILPYTARLGHYKPPAHKSSVINLSDKGICIKTNWAYKPGTKLFLTIGINGKSYEAEGVVIWAKKIIPWKVPLVKTDMGLKFTHVDPEFVKLYEEEIKDTR